MARDAEEPAARRRARRLLFSLALLQGLGCALGFSASMICQRIPGLTSAQRRLCTSRPDAMVAIGEGALLGMAECRRQFRHRRWNCTDTGASEAGFGHVFATGSREAAFVYAVSSAAVTYAVTRACTRGNLGQCGCDRSRQQQQQQQQQTAEPRAEPTGAAEPAASAPADDSWKWGGCSAHVKHGMRLARRFLDAREVEADERSLMNLHNNRAGRKAVKFGLLTECKCHGVSGSCTMKTCWKSLPAFSQVGAYLVQRYQRARRAAPFYGRSRPHEPSTLRRRPAYLRLRKGRGPRTPGAGRPAAHGVARPKPRDLVYLHESPSYCERDPGRGSAGTVGRLCNRTSTGPDGCRLLCCGRGYDTHRRTRVWQCQCKFHWCCFVRCQTCSERTEEHTCK